MKSIFKLMVSHFFIITVCILFFVSLSNSIAGVKSYPPDYPWSILLTGFVGALPSSLSVSYTHLTLPTICSV